MNDKGILSIALVLSIIGIFVLTAGTWLGFTITGMNRVTTIILAGAVFLVGMVSLLYGLQSKSSRGDHKYWKRTRMFAMAGMFLVSAFALMPTVYSINFLLNYKAVSQALQDDKRNLDDVVNRFKADQQERIVAYSEHLTNYVTNSHNNGNCSEALREHLDSVFHLEGGPLLGATLQGKVEEMISAKDNIAIKRNGSVVNALPMVTGLQTRIENNARALDPTQIPWLQNNLSGNFSEINGFINESAALYDLPEVRWDGVNGYYDALAKPAPVYEIGELHFVDACKRQANITVAGVLLALLAIALYLSDYLLTPVTGKQPPVDPKPSDRHGRIL